MLSTDTTQKKKKRLMLPRERSHHSVAHFKSIFTPALQFTKFSLRQNIALAQRETTEQIWEGGAEIMEGKIHQNAVFHWYQNMKPFYFSESHSAFQHISTDLFHPHFSRDLRNRESYVVSWGIRRDCKGKDKEITVGVNNKLSFGR